MKVHLTRQQSDLFLTMDNDIIVIEFAIYSRKCYRRTDEDHSYNRLSLRSKELYNIMDIQFFVASISIELYNVYIAQRILLY